jgi:ribonuclease PH
VSLTVDCDALQADGGSRTASITGACVELVIALRKMMADKIASARTPLTQVAAVSAGIVGGDEMLNSCYAQDSRAEVDFNVVMTSEGRVIEVQGTAEGEPFARESMERLLDLARDGIAGLMKMQNTVLK